MSDERLRTRATSARSATSTRRSPSSTSTRSGPTPPTSSAARGGKPLRAGVEVGALPRAAARVLARDGLARADDLHAARVAVAGRARLRRPAARLPDRRPRGAARAGRERRARRRSSWSTASSTSTSSAAGTPPVRVCIDVDLSLVARSAAACRIGAARSPVRTPEQAAALAAEIERRPGVELAGVMGYEAQIAGVGDDPPSRLRGRGDPLRCSARSARGARRAARRGRRRGASASPAGARARQRRRHRQRRAHGGRARGHRGHRGLGPLRARAVRPLLVVPRAARPRSSRCRSCAGPAGGVGHRARRRLPRLGLRPTRCACRARAARGPAPRRLEGAGEVQTPLRGAAADEPARSATACTSATPRRASCASASTGCTSSRATGRRRGADLPGRGPHLPLAGQVDRLRR